jgi:hypothetical protein
VRAAASDIAVPRPRRRSSGWRRGQTEVKNERVAKSSRQTLRAKDATAIEPAAPYPGSARWVAQQPGYLPPDPLTPTNLD